MKFHLEYTDTFGGEANYSWVKRETLEAPGNISTSKLRRLAKAAMDLSGVRGKWHSAGDMEYFMPRGMCTILFVTVRED